MPPLITRTVAFGSVPVEASVEILQPRDSEGLPVPLSIKQMNGTYCDGESPFPTRLDISHLYPEVPGSNDRYLPATVDGRVEVVIKSLAVDGVNLNLGKTCKTAEFGTLALSSREWYPMDPENLQPGVAPTTANIMTTPYFAIAVGGVLNGTVNIPPFSGCLTNTGEDISALLTSAVSGEVNNITLRAEGLGNYYCLNAPAEDFGQGRQCESFPDLPLP
jgi:hypothetical protein